MIHFDPSTLSDGLILAAYIIFFASYLVFAIGKFPGLKVDRTGAAIIGAVAMVAFRIVPGGDILKSIDFSTVVLLFSMVVVLRDGEELHGTIEWYDRNCLKLIRPNGQSNVLVYKPAIKYMFKEGEKS